MPTSPGKGQQHRKEKKRGSFLLILMTFGAEKGGW